MSLIRIAPVGTGKGGYVNSCDVSAILEEDRNGRTVSRIVLRNGETILTETSADELAREMMGGDDE